MIAATYTTTQNVGISLFDLIQAATPGQLPATAAFTGRVAEVQIQWVSGTFHLVWKPGAVVVATDSGFAFATTDRLLTLRCPNNNQLNLKDIYLAGANAADQGRVLAYSI